MSQEQTSTFTCFPNLPLELRRMIWRHTLPGPRVVYAAPRKLKGGKCSRVWSDCVNDGEGNEHFFDVELNGEVIHAYGWTILDGVPSTDRDVVRGADESVPVQEEEGGYPPPSLAECELEQGSSGSFAATGVMNANGDDFTFHPSSTFVDPVNSHIVYDVIDQAEVAIEVYELGPKQLWGMRSAELDLMVTLLICKESHQLAIDEKYVQAFGSIGCLSTIWFSYKHDTLYMEPEHVENGCTPEDLGYDGALVRKLALGHSKNADFTWNKGRMWDAEILSWFGNVTEFTFAAAAERDRVLFDDCALMDLAAALDHEDPRMEMYTSGYSPEKARQFRPAVKGVREKHLSLLEHDKQDLGIKRAELREVMRRDIETGEWDDIQMNTHFVMPKFKREAIVTTEQKAIFEQAKEKYEEEKRAYKMKLKVTSIDKDPIYCVVGAETSLAELWEGFAAVSGMPVDANARLSCCNFEGRGFDYLLPEPGYLLFELDGVVDGCAIEVAIVSEGT